MKKIAVLALVLLAAIGAFGQEKTIDKTEFDKVFRSSFRWTMNEAHREIEISESTIEFLPQTNIPISSSSALPPVVHNSSKIIIEHVPNVGYHSTYEFNYSNKTKKNENIRIAGKLYKREENGQWTESMPAASIVVNRNTKTVDQQIEYKFIGSENLGAQITNIYALVEKSKVVSLTGNPDSDSVNVTKYWFAEDGKLLKTESKREIRNGKSIGRFNSTRTYELDPTIKIEAPNLSSTK